MPRTPGSRKRACSAAGAVAAGVALATVSASGHVVGPAPGLLGVVAADAQGPVVLRLTEGFALHPCLGGVGVQSVNMFSWRPGSQPVKFEDGDAAYVEPGSAVVLQVHYNNQFIQPGQELQPDLTGVAFWTLPEGERPDRVVVRYPHFGFVGPTDEVPTGKIAAGDAHVVGGLNLPMSTVSSVAGQYVQGELIGMTPHMHTLGSRLAETLVRAGGEQECMVDVPQWDFEWQFDYYFQTPTPYGSDDRMDLVCEYDNSPANQPYLDGQRIQPQDVFWGEGSLDEMCLNYVWLRYPTAQYFDALAAGG